jgi:hypothetical protein
MLQDVLKVPAAKDKKPSEKYSTANPKFTKGRQDKTLQFSFQKL